MEEELALGPEGEDDGFRDKTQAVGFIPLEAIVGTQRKATLIVIGGPSFGKSYPLDEENTEIGRAPECGIHLEDDGISRNHAKIVRVDDEWIMVDLGSTNGTYHDGERIQVHTLADGDKVQVGLGTILRFQFQDEIDQKYQQSMYESKTRDPLTQAFNRGYFMEAIERELAFAERHDQDLSLILLDIDHFKRVNDTFGHQAGDVALKQVSAAVMNMARKEDVFARYGGEEFGVLLRDTSKDAAFIMAERIRRTIEKLEIVHNGRRIPVTVSLGIACMSNELQDPGKLIEAADERLYAAKHNGRNRVEADLFD